MPLGTRVELVTPYSHLEINWGLLNNGKTLLK